MLTASMMACTFREFADTKALSSYNLGAGFLNGVQLC